MNRQTLKNKLDYIPLLILIVCAFILIIKVILSDVGFLWKHYVGFAGLLLTIAAFFRNHKIGVITLGIVLLTGLIGLLSFSAAITISTHSVGIGNVYVPVFIGQPVFLLWFLIHLSISGKYFFGIATKKYWKDLIESKTAE